MNKKLKQASADIEYHLDIKSTLYAGFSECTRTIKLNGTVSQEAVGGDYEVTFESNKKPKEKISDTSVHLLREGFTFFPELIEGLEEDGPLSVNANCSFAFSVKTKNFPRNLWRAVARNTIYSRNMRGRLELFQLYPRLFLIQQLCGLKTTPEFKYRAVVHLMNGTDSLGWHSQLGNSGDELYVKMMEKPSLEDGVSKSKRPTLHYCARIFGRECAEKEAFAWEASHKDFGRALVIALS